MRGSTDMKGDSNRFLARSEGSGGKNDCGGAANIGLLGLLGKVRTTCQFLFAKQHRYVMAERREKTPGAGMNCCFF